jgi:sialidase-1
MKYKYIFFFILIAGFGFSQSNSHNIALGVIENTNLFSSDLREGVACFRIPSIITAVNGDLIVAIDERAPSCGDLKWSKDINIAIRRSSDNGKTWTPIEIIVDFPLGQSASDPSMILDRETSEIFLFYNFMDLDKELDVYYLHVIKSSDHGKTWSSPKDITHQIAKPGWKNDFKFITSGRGIQTKSGTLLHCMVNLNSGMHLFGSNDHGKTWFFIDNPIKPANESKVVELTENRWMINSRANTHGLRYVHISKDEGKSWNTYADSTLIDPGCNASIVRYTSVEDGYKKNRLLFSNAKMKKGRKNLTVRISYDEGETWSEGKTIYEGGSAYSSMTILENGDIGLFFEKDGYKENVFVSFSLKWLTDKKDKYKNPKKEEKKEIKPVSRGSNDRFN